MVAGPPGVGKSMVALAIAIKTGVPTLYVSADSHSATMALRALAMITGQPQFEVEQRMLEDQQWAAAILHEHTSHIKWMFDASPTLGDLEDEINLFQELHGEPASLWIVDNAVDITFDSGDEFSSLRALMRELKWWSREQNAAALVLHHTSESYSGNPCPPRGALHGKIAQVPATILTLAAEPGLLAVAPVKNRYGRADASGSTPIWMDFMPEAMVVKDLDS